MMWRIKAICITVLGIGLWGGFIPQANAQFSMEMNGYVSNLQTGQFAEIDGDWLSESLLHNRLNFKFYKGEHYSLSAEFRNRFIWGNMKEVIPNYTETVGGETGWVNLSATWFDGNSATGISKIDRLVLHVNYSKLDIKLGRQRINWGRTYVWNNNDIFNSYSFFDFDYIEKPGADAIRVTYYANNTSQVEFAAKANREGKVTAAAYVMFNKWAYDVQVLGGLIDEQEYCLGAGWAGSIWNLGFKGELNYLFPKQEYKSLLSQALLLNVGLEYAFGNQLMLRSEFFYNQAAPTLTSVSELILSQSTIRSLSFSKHAVFVGADYPVTPLFQVALSGMWMPELKGLFVGPSVGYSLTENLQLSLVGQYYNLKFNADERTGSTQVFLKLQQSF